MGGQIQTLSELPLTSVAWLKKINILGNKQAYYNAKKWLKYYIYIYLLPPKKVFQFGPFSEFVRFFFISPFDLLKTFFELFSLTLSSLL